VDESVAQLLLVSIQQDKLVFLCGAGLSMALPSHVPSATELAEHCSQEYERRALPPPLPAAARTDLEKLARFFLANEQLGFLIDELVQWDRFCGDSNSGHETIADFVTCGASFCAITANFDILIEKAAQALGEKAFRAALDGDEANVHRSHRPLLKIHGCFQQRDYTLWCCDQLDCSRTDEVSKKLQARLARSRAWLQANVPRRQLVLVGFWSDWRYLNTVLIESVRDIHPVGILLVDPLPQAELKVKAPELWAWASSFGPHFRHVQVEAEVFLRELQEIFSRNILERVLKAAAGHAPEVCRDFSVVENALGGLDAYALYALRRDFAGAPSGTVAKWKDPQDWMDAVGRVHLEMLSSGARLDGSSYLTTDGKRVRVVNGRTLPMNKVRSEYASEPTKATPDDYFICAAPSSDIGPPRIIPRATPSIVRPGSTAKWLTVQQARDKGIL